MAPRGLPKANQALCGGFCFGTCGRRACAIFEISDTRHQRLLAEEPAECADIFQFQIGERIGHIRSVAKCNSPTSHCMADFIDSGANWRFDMFAALCIGKSFPVAPSLHHEKSLNILQIRGPRTRQVIMGSVTSMGAVDKCE